MHTGTSCHIKRWKSNPIALEEVFDIANYEGIQNRIKGRGFVTRRPCFGVRWMKRNEIF